MVFPINLINVFLNNDLNFYFFVPEMVFFIAQGCMKKNTPKRKILFCPMYLVIVCFSMEASSCY